METIKIAHLYYDLMNLYGEHGNILALRHHLEAHKVRVITHYLSIEDEIDFSKYDIFYIGSGNKEAFHLVLDDVMKRKDDFINAFKKKKFFFITGNALDLFGKSYHTLEGAKYETLGFFSYETHETDFRIVGEQVYETPKLEHEIIGFQNKCSTMKFVSDPHLFDVKVGTGYVPKSLVEGICKNHFYGTYLLGPLFIRNPYFTEYVVSEILKFKKTLYTPYVDELEIKAYEEYQKNLLHEELSEKNETKEN